MDPLVQDFFRKNDEELQKNKSQEKEKVLIENGLYTEERVYSESRGWGDSFYDKEKKQYYTRTRKPVEVTDEEYERIVEIVNAKKLARTQNPRNMSSRSTLSPSIPAPSG